jgi:hypothetical protein
VSGSIWSILGIEPTQDASIIRRAYAAMLKTTRPEDDPEGFVRLRRAYESALAKARTPAISTPTAPPESVVPPALVELLKGVASPADAEPRAAPASHSAPSAPDDVASAPDAAGELKELRARFAALKSALRAPQSPTSGELRSLLEAFLQSPALEVLTVQMEFEPALARLFLKYPHAFAPLWHVAIDRWKWRERGRKLRGEIAAVLALADDAKSLHELQESSPSRVYAALTQDPNPIRLWIQIVVFRLDQEVREAMEYWNSPAPVGTDADALAWWRNFFSRPQPRPLLLQVTGLLTVLVLPVAWLATRSLIPGVLVLLAGLGVTLGWWGLVDWPRQRFLELQISGPWWLPVGWAPVIVVALMLAAFGPDFSPLTWAAMVLTAVGLFWAILTMPARADFAEYAPLLLALGLSNVPIVVWWIVVSDTPRAHPTLPMWVTFLGALVTLLFGLPTLWREFQSQTRSFRQTVRAVIAVIALAMAAVLLFGSIQPESSMSLLAVLSAIVLAHRVASANLNERQLRVRSALTLVPSFAFLQLEPGWVVLGSPVQTGGAAFMVGVALIMGLCLYNEWRGFIPFAR